jgi:uncharacterized membrane protein HdeD (DUF308 family)
VNQEYAESERRFLDVALIVGALVFFLGILMFFFLDQLMFGHVTILGPIVIFLGIATVLLNLGLRIKGKG